MKTIHNILLVFLLSAISAPSLLCQQNRSVAKKVTKQTSNSTSNTERTSNNGVSQRYLMRFGQNAEFDTDIQIQKVIYRNLDIKKSPNGVLSSQGENNLFSTVVNLIATNQLPAFNYTDGIEDFTDKNIADPVELFSRFDIPFKHENGEILLDNDFLNSENIESYYLIEHHEFDARAGRTRIVAQAICPVLLRTSEFSNTPLRFPLFWIKVSDALPLLPLTPMSIDNHNNLPQHTIADFFTMNLYSGEIYKTANHLNLPLSAIYTTPTELKAARDSIEKSLTDFHNAFRPNRFNENTKKAPGKKPKALSGKGSSPSNAVRSVRSN